MAYYNPKDPADYKTLLADEGFLFRYNEVSNRIEFFDPTTNQYQNYADRDMAFFRLFAKKHQMYKNDMLDSIMVLASDNRYHPIKLYFNGLQWNRQSNIKELSSFLKADDPMICEIFLRKWFIGAVVKVYENGLRNPVLVLDGGQNIGKSTFARKLCPDPIYFQEGSIRPDEKDHEIKLTQKLVWEIGELENTTSKSAVGALKDFLSRVNVSVRIPFDKYPISQPAMTSFIGTINEMAGFLNDDSGSTRFRVLRIESIDFGYNNLDIGQCWAEAVAAYHAGERSDLDAPTEAISNLIKQNYQVPNPIEDAILQYFTIDPKDNQNFCTAFQIRSILLDKDYANLGGRDYSPQRMASTLKKLGCEKRQKWFSGNTVLQVYYGIRPKQGVYIPSLP
nr:MAG TPA: virulence associated protein E [Bacteriophage sp.]